MSKVARLLDMIVPKHYRLRLEIDDSAFAFYGSQEIIFDLKQHSQELVLHAVGLEIVSAKLDGELEVNGVEVQKDDQTIRLRFDHKVAPGEHRLQIHYRGTIQDSLHGFYRSRYERDGAERWIFTTQMEGVHAREVFVCIDEPAAKAVFELTLVVPDKLMTLSNMPVQRESKLDDGRREVLFMESPRMSTYLLAWIVGDLEIVESRTSDGVLVRAAAIPGQKDQLAYALEVGVKSLEFYTDYFGVPYPLPKLDMVAIPDFAAGAMENWGLVTYRETALLLDPAQTSLAHKQRVAEVVAHELAHQWFGNLVTMKWWNDLWLNEGFATWCADLARDFLHPEWKIWQQFVSESTAYAMELDGLANTHPIEVEVEDPRQLDEIFDAVSYEKGASVIRMLHEYLGDEAFRRGLQLYIERFSYKNAVTHDLWAAMSEASGKPVDEFMSAWTSQPGYPVLMYEDGRASQERFYSSPKERIAARQSASDRSVWPIPLEFRVGGGIQAPSRLVREQASNLPDEVVGSDWFKPNPGQSGFYRSLYTRGMIDALQGPMESKELDTVDRFGIVDDVFATTAAGLTDSAVALRLCAALRRESDYVVWGGITGGLGGLEAVVEDEPLRERIDRFGAWLVEPNVERLGWEAIDDESTFDRLMRPVVLQQAIRFGNDAVTREGRERFEAYLRSGEIEPDLRPVVLYAAARHGGKSEFDAMLEQYRTELIPQVKMSFLTALGRFRDPEMIDRYLGLALSEDVRPQDLYVVVAWTFRNRHGRDKAWEWLKSNWDVLLERYGEGGHMLERFPSYAGMGFATYDMAQAIGDFFGAQSHPALKRPTAQAIEGVELKAAWYERDKQAIESFMKDWEASHS